MAHTNTATILVIDDHPYSRLATVDILKFDGYKVLESEGNGDLVAEATKCDPDLILLDIMMPENNGLDVCQRLKANPKTALIPVILITVLDDQASRLKSREIGADAFLLKPLERVDLLARVDLLIQKKRLAEWVEQIEQVLLLIAQTIEDRFDKNFASELSFSQFAQAFGEYLQLSPPALQDLVFAARFHDIGTLAIPDAIMLKKGELTESEKELVKQHVLVGEKIFQPLSSRREVGRIIRHHHERWDGSGYPDGLVGDQIPWLAQIFQILDIYDALTSDRSYKDAVSSENALVILNQEVERGWRNPDLVAKFADFIDQQTQNKS